MRPYGTPAPVGTNLAPLLLTWHIGAILVPWTWDRTSRRSTASSRSPPRPAARRLGRWPSGCGPARRRDPAGAAGRAGRGGRGDHVRTRAGLGRAAAARRRPRVRRDAAAGGRRRRRRRRDAAVAAAPATSAPTTTGGDGADQPAHARAPEGPGRAGRGGEGAVGQRLARPRAAAAALERRRRPRRAASAPQSGQRFTGWAAEPDDRPTTAEQDRISHAYLRHPRADLRHSSSASATSGSMASDRADTVVEVRPSDPAKGRRDRRRADPGRVRRRPPADQGAQGLAAARRSRAAASRSSSRSSSRGLARARARPASRRCAPRVGWATAASRPAPATSRSTRPAPVQLKTGAGDINVEQVAGDAELTTGTGAVRVGGIDGTGVDQELQRRHPDRRGRRRPPGEGGQRRHRVDRPHASVAAKTANGDIRLGEVGARRGRRARPRSASVEIGVADGVAAWLDLDTRLRPRPQRPRAAAAARSRRGHGRGARPQRLRRHHDPARRRSRHDTGHDRAVEGVRAALRRRRRARRPRPRRPGRHGVRAARAQRRRQDDARARAGDAAASRPAAARACSATTSSPSRSRCAAGSGWPASSPPSTRSSPGARTSR